MDTTRLYRPVNKVELDLIQALNWKAFPPRLPEQPIFYPVTNMEYARQITVEWNLPTYKNGFVTQFDVDKDYFQRFKIEKVGLKHHTELWVPSEELDTFNTNIIGPIQVVDGYAGNENDFYVFIKDVIQLADRGIAVTFEFLIERPGFVMTEFATLAGIPLVNYLDIPRKLNKDEALNRNYFVVLLKSEEDRTKIKINTVELLR